MFSGEIALKNNNNNNYYLDCLHSLLFFSIILCLLLHQLLVNFFINLSAFCQFSDLIGM